LRAFSQACITHLQKTRSLSEIVMEVERLTKPARITYGNECSDIICIIVSILSDRVRQYTYYVNHNRISVFDPEKEGTTYDILLNDYGVVNLVSYTPETWKPGITDMISCGSFHIADPDPSSHPEDELTRLVETIARKSFSQPCV
jgi:hypothetical protein